mgnify:CR=1 FL=1
MTDNILKIIDVYKKFYDNIVVHISSSKSKNIQLNGLETESIDYASDTTVYLRAVKEGRQISCGFSGVDVEAIEAFLNIYETAIMKLPSDENRFIPDYTAIDGDLKLVDNVYNEISMKDLIDIATKVTESAIKHDDRVTAVKQATASASIKELSIISSAGPILKRQKTLFSAGAYAIASDGTEDRDGYDYVSSTSLAKLPYNSTGIFAAENACSLLSARHINTDQYHIMFSADVMADFVELLLDLVDADSVYKGVSMLGDKLGQSVASSIFTLIDDPLMYGGAGSILFDDEGQACAPIEIIKDGQLKSFLHNSYTAKALGMPNNARAVLSGGGNIGIGCSNVILASTGTLSDSCPEYLKVTEVMGMHTADPVSGDFSVGISGMYYKDGKPAYPFKEAALSGNLADLLKGLLNVSDNKRTFGNITTADALFDKMTVSGV